MRPEVWPSRGRQDHMLPTVPQSGRSRLPCHEMAQTSGTIHCGFKAVVFKAVVFKLFEGTKDRAVKCLQCMRSLRRHSDTIDACIGLHPTAFSVPRDEEHADQSCRGRPDPSACLQFHGAALAAALAHVSQRACTTLLKPDPSCSPWRSWKALSQRACPSGEGLGSLFSNWVASSTCSFVMLNPSKDKTLAWRS